jgi:hypothetical protein
MTTKFGQGLLEPHLAGESIDHRLVAQERSAEHLVSITENDPGARSGGGEGGSQTAGAGANDQHVTVYVGRVVGIGVGLDRWPTQSCCTPNEVFKQMPARPHEGFVVKPSR